MTDSRVRVSYGETVRTGEYESARLDLSVEKDCVGGMDERSLRQALLKQLVQEVEDWKQLRIHGPTALPKPVHAPVATQPVIPARPEPGSLTSVTDQQIIEELDTLDWIDNKKRTGWFAPLEEIPLPIRAALISRFNTMPTKSLRLGDYVFTRFGDDNGLIGKFEAKKQEKLA